MTTFTLEELNDILNLFDRAVRADGIAAAQKAMPLISKLELMAKELQQPVATEEGHA